MGQPEDRTEIQNFFDYLADSVRMVKSVASWRGTVTGCGSRLEVHARGVWAPVVCYEMLGDKSWRHEYSLSGKKHVICVDLPARAVQELAENDLTGNWKIYCERFLTGSSISD